MGFNNYFPISPLLSAKKLLVHVNVFDMALIQYFLLFSHSITQKTQAKKKTPLLTLFLKTTSFLLAIQFNHFINKRINKDTKKAHQQISHIMISEHSISAH